jgi:hypothetical protein
MTLCFIGGGQLQEFVDALVPYVKAADKALVIPFATEETEYTRLLERTYSIAKN